ncbi:unnamed protein product [Dibothriocephalus latus]|uniref:BACK domain-containing protein n=1 Tax=Dibothriocephalus latus TaxID=60516 RepID=A0A3P7M5T3_DIBLA|nr:unnamed protein product [Dibothriocephalus latus]
MSDSQAQFFEDELPLIRSCRALNELRLAEELTDLTIEVNQPTATVLKTALVVEALVVGSEEDIFCAISRWASNCNEFGDKKMNEDLPMMLKEIQWDQTSAQFRGRLLDSHFIFQNSTESSIFVVGGSSAQQQGITSVQEFTVRERRWRTRAPLACRRQEHAAAVVRVAAADGKEGGEKSLIAIVGGCFQEGDTWTQLASCELYDVNQNR